MDFLITISIYFYIAQTISSPFQGVGHSWVGYCWDSPPSRWTFQETFALPGLDADCLRHYPVRFPSSSSDL